MMDRLGRAFTRVAALALVAMVATCGADHGGDNPPEPMVTKAPIFIPYYNEDVWSFVRGSIIGTNSSARETTYTIFCPAQTAAACDLTLEFPFIIVEGPGTLKFHGTLTSTYIADLECTMNGTTAATCSGYSSYRSGYTNGMHTGPTEVSWTSTLTGSNVHWGTLTLADKPSATEGSRDRAGSNMGSSDAIPSSDMFYSSPTPTGAASNARSDVLVAAKGALLSMIVSILMI